MFGLSFINTAFLITACTIVIPLLIHLFVKTKPQRLYFSSLKFLRAIVEEQRRIMSINQIILLILRMLVLLFVVLALARPVMQIPFGVKKNYHPPTAVAFILDTSPSMDYVINQKNQIQYGLEIINLIQKEITSSDQSILLTSDYSFNALKSRMFAGPIPQSELQNIEFTWTPEPLYRLIQQATSDLTQTDLLHKEIYIISDLQQTELPTDSAIPITMINTFSDSLRYNLAIESVGVRKELINEHLQRIVEFQVANYSPVTLKDQIVRLIFNGITISEKMIDLNPFEKKSDFFMINNELPNWNHGYVEVRNERFLPDNRYFFTYYLDPSPKIGILSNSGPLPWAIESLADIYLGVNGGIEYLDLSNLQLSDKDKYHFIILYLSAFNSRLATFLTELHKNEYRCLFILHPNLTQEAKDYLLANYNFEILSLSNNSNIPITSFHQWHRIVGNFNFSPSFNIQATPAHQIILGQNNTSLVNTELSPLMIENKDLFLNIDFNQRNQSLLTFPAFPIIVYRSFSWISQFDSGLNNFYINEAFPRHEGTLISPTGKEFAADNTGFRFNEPGLWTYIMEGQNSSYLAVNMSDYENQSMHNPIKEINIAKINIRNEFSKTEVLGLNNQGTEIRNFFYWLALILLATEMIFIILLQRKARE